MKRELNALREQTLARLCFVIDFLKGSTFEKELDFRKKKKKRGTSVMCRWIVSDRDSEIKKNRLGERQRGVSKAEGCYH
jgi:hypothetical protein